MTMLLDRISGPSDVKAISAAELDLLAEEIRKEIVRTTAINGGHMATNLGVVELSIALHRVLNSPSDKIIWDVGNQCYTHKLITGRRDRFSTIRMPGGLSGFVNREESPHDHMTAGHAGTALASAVGIAAARDLRGDDYRVVAVVGDGALTSGLSYEALNNLGTHSSQLLCILNDNDYSISPSRGALARTLRQAKDRILDGTIFDELGITYLGPVDGHNMQLLIDVLQETVQMQKPVVLHVVTQKGRGYQPAETDPARFHGVSPIDVATGAPLKESSAPSFSSLFGAEMTRLAAEDDRVVAITAAMPAGTGLTEFAEKWPARFFDVGIAEQHAVTFAAGLAVGECRPVVAIYSTFLQRAYDQVIHDVALQNLPVTFVLDRAGIAGADGATHHGVFDLAFLRTIPRMALMAPKDANELAEMLRLSISLNGPAAIRIPRGSPASPQNSSAPHSPVEFGRAELMREGGDVLLLALGTMAARAMEAADELARRGINATVINARFVKPLDDRLILEHARRVRRVFTFEEHIEAGGFGSAVLELLAQKDVPTPVTVLGLPDCFLEHGSPDQMLDECDLSARGIVERVLAAAGPEQAGCPSSPIAVDPARARTAIEAVQHSALPGELEQWIRRYEGVGHRNSFLWKWVLKGVQLTSLPCVDPKWVDDVNTTKVLGVMLDVLLDDVADQSGSTEFLEQLLRIPLEGVFTPMDGFTPSQIAYAEVTAAIWNEIQNRVRRYPCYDAYAGLLSFDYGQLFNAMRYSHLVNENVRLFNLAEHDLYLPHNMHMMVSGTLDLMCAPKINAPELGSIREVLWHAQNMGRVGNLVTTWERELPDRDFTSGVFARALSTGVVTPDALINGRTETTRDAIKASDCEAYFLRRWQAHRSELADRAQRIRSFDVSRLIAGLEELIVLHLGSRGLK